MKRIITILLLFASSVAFAQPISSPRGSNDAPSSALMSKVLSLWLANDTASLSTYYDHSSTDTFFSLIPLKLQGWDDYKNAPQRQFTAFRGFEGKLNPDAVVHVSGTTAWGTATWTGSGRLGNGNGADLQGRWTVIWEKKNGKWLIVHDHFSIPWTIPKEQRYR